MSKSIKSEKVSRGRNMDMQEMLANPSGAGPHTDRRNKRKSNPKNHWSLDEENDV